jgi:glycosyltransferase involved in cell wall biosynthesis
LRRKMGTAAERRVLEAYTWEVKARTIDEIYRQVV